jgi:hypothetical protein
VASQHGLDSVEGVVVFVREVLLAHILVEASVFIGGVFVGADVQVEEGGVEVVDVAIGESFGEDERVGFGIVLGEVERVVEVREAVAKVLRGNEGRGISKYNKREQAIHRQAELTMSSTATFRTPSTLNQGNITTVARIMTMSFLVVCSFSFLPTTVGSMSSTVSSSTTSLSAFCIL